MGDYFDKDVTNLNANQVAALIRLRLREFPSVQLFRKKSRGSARQRTILRTWRVDFAVEGAQPDP